MARSGSLRDKLIRVAYYNPETRSDLLPLLRTAANDVTERVLREAQNASTLHSAKPAIQQALLGNLPPKGVPTPGEQRVLSKLQDGQELGPWANIVLYNDATKFYKPSEHAAFIKLLRRGVLRIIQDVPDPYGRYGEFSGIPFNTIRDFVYKLRKR